MAFVFIGVGLVLRVALLVFLASKPLHDDAADYHQMAAQLLDGTRFEPDWPPGLPYYIYPFYAAFGASPTVARVAMLVLYLALSVLLLQLGRRIGGGEAATRVGPSEARDRGRTAGTFAVAFFALFPSSIFLSVTPLTQLPTALLLTLAIFLAMRFLDEPPRAEGERVPRGAAGKRALDAGWFGVTLAALLLVRPSNVALCLFAPLVLFAVTRKISIVALPALALVLLVGAWTMKAHSLTGRWLFINNANSQNLYYGNNPWTPLYRTWWFGSHKRGEPDVPDAYLEDRARIAALPSGERDQAFSRAAVEHIKARPDLFAVRSLSRVRTFFAFDTFTGAQVKKGGGKLLSLGVIAIDGAMYLLAALLAISGFFKPPGKRAAWVIGIAVILYAGPYFASFSHPTYHFPVMAPLAALAAAVAARFLDGESLIPARRRGLFWGALAIFGLIQAEWAINMFSRL